MKRLKGTQPGPWWVNCLQVNAGGRPTRPRILDANSKPLRLSSVKNATLAAMAPVLLDRLEKLIFHAELLHMQVNSALAVNTAEGVALVNAREVLRIADRIEV